MDIVVTGDQQYMMPIAVALRSLDEALRDDERCRVHVLHHELSRADEDILVGCTTSGRVTLDVRRVDTAHLAGYPVTAELPLANYLRLVAPAIIDADRLLYVDADTIIRHSPMALAAHDLEGRTVGAVRDAAMPFVSWWRAMPNWQRAGLDALDPYFNAGVMLIDVERWREGSVADRFEAVIRGDHPGRFHVQAPLNEVLAHDWSELPLTWNALHVCFGRAREAPWRGSVFPTDQLALAAGDPAIVHLTGSKPWTWGSSNPWTAEWYSVLDRTPFAGWRPHRRGGRVMEALPEPIANRVASGARGLRRAIRRTPPAGAHGEVGSRR